MLFNDSIIKNFTSSFGSWFTDRKAVNILLEHQVGTGSAQSVNSPKYLIVAHPSAVRLGVPIKAKNCAIFLMLEKIS